MATRIALLLCGNLAGQALRDNGSFTDIYTRYLKDTAPVEFTIDAYDVRNQEYPKGDAEDTYSSFILTGSTWDSAYDDTEWITTLAAFILRIASTKPHLKLVGMCFGHQIIAHALGGECVPNGDRWEVGPTPIRLTGLGRQLFGGSDTLTLQQMHRDHVPSAPPNFHLLGSSDLSPNQAMVLFSPSSSPSPTHPSLASIQIFTTQGHPELTEPIVSSIITELSASGAMPPSTVEDAARRRLWDTQSDAIGKVGKVVWGVILNRDSI